jgi:hypothetical protein
VLHIANPRERSAVTTPTKKSFDLDVIKPHDRPNSTRVTSDIAVERMVSLLNEVVAKGALPAL